MLKLKLFTRRDSHSKAIAWAFVIHTVFISLLALAGVAAAYMAGSLHPLIAESPVKGFKQVDCNKVVRHYYKGEKQGQLVCEININEEDDSTIKIFRGRAL